jgi:hypothetical protein
LGHNLEDSDECGLTAAGDQPLTDPQVYPGTYRDTITIYEPIPYSPAVDAADPVSCPATDQRGYPRPMDGNGDGQVGCDIGAIERDAWQLVPAEDTVFLPFLWR